MQKNKIIKLLEENIGGNPHQKDPCEKYHSLKKLTLEK